jgi:hypothetical protein
MDQSEKSVARKETSVRIDRGGLSMLTLLKGRDTF